VVCRWRTDMHCRLELSQVRVEHLVVGQVEPMPPVVPPWPLREIHLAQVVRHDQALIGGCLRLTRPIRDLDDPRLRFSAGQNARKVVVGACQLPLARKDCGCGHSLWCYD